MKISIRPGLLVFVAFFILSDLSAQVEKKISFNVFFGLARLPKGEKLNPAGQATNIYGGYPSPPSVGLGFNYRFTDRVMLSNNLFYFATKKNNHAFSAAGLRINFKYHPLKDWRKFSPYLTAGFAMNFVNLGRDPYVEDFQPDSNANVIGSGISVTRITYQRNQVRLSWLPTPGASLGAGMDFRISPKINLFLEYTYNPTFATSSLIKENFPFNNSKLNYGYATAGMTFKLLKPMKQMLASLKKEDWDGDPTVTIRGSLIYKNPKKSKEIPVQVIDKRDTVVVVLPSNKSGYFEYRNLRADNYDFMLERKNKNIEKAEIKVIHDNTKVDIFEELPQLEMMDDLESDNIITRDNNFAVILREGFQHEVDVTVLGNKVIGRITPVSYDTLCRNMLVLLKDVNDSVIAVSRPEKDCSFSFPNIEQGKHTIVFVRNGIEKDINFAYKFENPPLIRRQYNTEEDSIDYSNFEQVEIPEDTVDIDDILLSKRYERKITSSESLFEPEVDNSVKPTENITEEKPVPLKEIQPGPAYSPEGMVTEPKGYGVQVGAFSNPDNLKEFCDKLKRDRNEPVFIQAVHQEDSYHPVIYRVIVGDYPDQASADQQRPSLKKSGYDTVLRKHRPHEKSRGR